MNSVLSIVSIFIIFALCENQTITLNGMTPVNGGNDTYHFVANPFFMVYVSINGGSEQNEVQIYVQGLYESAYITSGTTGSMYEYFCAGIDTKNFTISVYSVDKSPSPISYLLTVMTIGIDIARLTD